MPARFDVLSGAGEGRVFHFDKRRVSVGTDASCDLVLNTDGDVVSRHCLVDVVMSPDGYTLVNYGSCDISVNGVVVRSSTRRSIRSGDLIAVTARGPNVRFRIVSRIPEDIANPIPAAAAETAWPRVAAKRSFPHIVRGKEVAKWKGVAAGALCVLILGYGLWWARDPAPPRIDTEEVAAATTVREEGLAAMAAGSVAPEKLDDPDHSAAVVTPSEPVNAIREFQQETPAIALIGEVEGVKLPWCSGWICGSHEVATSAPMACVLQEVIAGGGKVFAFLQSGAIVKIERFRQHSSFKVDGDGPVSAAIAVGETTEELPHPALCRQSADLPKRLAGMQVEVVSYEIPQQDQGPSQNGRFTPKPYNKLDPPRLTRISGEITSIRSISGAPLDLPLLQVEIVGTPGCDGGAVVDETGAVIGTLLCMKADDKFFVVLSDHMDDFRE